VLGKLLHDFPFKIVASDISAEMMALAREEYPGDRLVGCVQADITQTGLPRNSFSCVITLGFLHRVPREIKSAALRELSALSSRVVIVTCSIDTPLQRLKHAVLRLLKPNHIPAPCPMRSEEIEQECIAQGMRVVGSYRVFPVLSAHTLFVLEK
jgi:ubiquinone/menaquinone biosynthesis C-methylase UbiE